MVDKITAANIFLFLRQIQAQTILRGITPSSLVQLFDVNKKGHLTFVEFQQMLETILEPQYKGTIKLVWDFIIEQFKSQNFVTGEMLDKIVQQVCEIDKQIAPQSQQLQKNSNNNMRQDGTNGWNSNQQPNQQPYKQLNQQQQQQQQGIFQQQNYQQQNQNQQNNFQQYPQQNQQQQYPQQNQQQQYPQQNQYQQYPQQNQYQQYPQQEPHQQYKQKSDRAFQQMQMMMQPQNQRPLPHQVPNQSPNKLQPIQNSNTSRTYQQIFKILSKTIHQNQTTIKEMFNMFDQDNDKYLNMSELRGFLFNQVPQLNEEEFLQVVQSLNYGLSDVKNIKVSLFQLMKQTQDGNAMINSIKLDKPSQKVLNVEKNQKARQEIFTKNTMPQGLLESNIYENQSNPNMLTSKIAFEEYFVIDQNTPGLQKFLRTFSELKQMNQLYVDQKFRADQSSLGGRLNSKVQAWMRPKDIWKNKSYQFFVKGLANSRVGLGKWISPSDISQGELGDCYFLASVSSIACRRPDAILDLFVTRKLNPCGIYCVRLNIDGQWTTVTVDDQFPTRNGRPVFTQSKDMELWVMVLEKAWAKIFGSYSNIEAGVAREVMRALTGAPTKVLMTSDVTFLEDLEKCCQQKCIMVSGSYCVGDQDGLTETVVNRTGLVPGHAYSILKIKEIIHPTLGKVKLIKLRNPWAQKEWLGDWSEKSPLWTPEIKKQVNYVTTSEGVFYMDISSFIQHFSDVQVCLMRPSYQYRSEQIVSTKKNSIYFAVLIEVAGEYFFTVTQHNKRFKDGKEYSPARIIVGEKVANGKYKLAASCNKYADREIFCTGQFKVGVYMVQIKVNWQQSEDMFTFSSYGKGQVGINQVEKIPDFIRSIFMDQAQTFDRKKIQKLIQR